MKFISKVEIDKGWSSDKKYCALTEDGAKYLLRVNQSNKKDKLKKLFEVSEEIEKTEITFCNAIEYGLFEDEEDCIDGEYILQRWIEGEDASDIIPQLSKEMQYDYGFKVGEI